MKRCLVVATLAVGLMAFGGCDDEDDGGGTGGRGGSGGSTGGRGGTGGTGGTGGSTGGTGGGGDAADVPATDSGDTGGGGDAGDTASAFCAAYTPNSGVLPGVEAMAFCMEYSSACTFGGDMRYTNMGDCVTKYMAAAAGVKSCRAGHLCNAIVGGTPAAKTTHCPHATGLLIAACM